VRPQQFGAGLGSAFKAHFKAANVFEVDHVAVCQQLLHLIAQGGEHRYHIGPLYGALIAYQVTEPFNIYLARANGLHDVVFLALGANVVLAFGDAVFECHEDCY
tara:strand:+ start:13136 stop:13447 length:312 start_codon:yes stop_codon:yes gene_type:complete